MNLQVIKLHPAPSHARHASRPSRVCQPCTACCDGWLRIDVFDQPVYPGKPCPNSTGRGCGNYAERPQHPCVAFDCGWVRDASHLPDWMRPSEAKVVVLPAWTQWRTFPVDLALPVGERVPYKALKWLMQYSKQSFRPLIYTEQECARNGEFTGKQHVRGFGPPPFLTEMQYVIAQREGQSRTFK